MLRSILSRFALLLPVLMISAQATAADPTKKLAKKLDKLDLQYEVDQDGDFKLIMTLVDSGDRTQMVFVDPDVNSYGTVDVRRVLAPAYRVPPEGITAELGARLLRDSNSTIVGNWQIMSFGEFEMVVFTHSLPLKAKPSEIMDVVNAVAYTSDKMEAELTGADEF